MLLELGPLGLRLGLAPLPAPFFFRLYSGGALFVRLFSIFHRLRIFVAGILLLTGRVYRFYMLNPTGGHLLFIVREKSAFLIVLVPGPIRDLVGRNFTRDNAG